MLAETLIDIRTGLGFKTARSFYNDYLRTKGGKLDFTYPYYMKIEGGRVLPSSAIVATIASTLGREQADSLILSYCAMLFPKKGYLFRPSRISTANAQSGEKQQPRTSYQIVRQRELTVAQVQAICRTREHYLAFLIVQLARHPITLEEINRTLKTGKLGAVLDELQEAQVIAKEPSGFTATTLEVKYPAANTNELRQLYRKIDQWNLELNANLEMSPLVEKTLTHRISASHLAVIQQLATNLVDVAKLSSETQAVNNDRVLHLTLLLSAGALPG